MVRGGGKNSLKAVTGRYSTNIFDFQGNIGCLDKFREKVKTANLGGSNFLLVDAI